MPAPKLDAVPDVLVLDFRILRYRLVGSPLRALFRSRARTGRGCTVRLREK